MNYPGRRWVLLVVGGVFFFFGCWRGGWCGFGGCCCKRLGFDFGFLVLRFYVYGVLGGDSERGLWMDHADIHVYICDHMQSPDCRQDRS